MRALHRLGRTGELVVGLACLAAAGLIQDGVHGLDWGGTELVELPAEYLGATIDPRIIQRLLGTRLLVSDLVWIDTLIKSDIRREKKAFSPIYRAFRTVVTLDPDHIYAYYVGGLYLSVVKDDIQGATALLKQGVEYLDSHPYTWWEAWRIYWALGYNLMIEEGDIEGGSQWIRKAAKMLNATQFVRNLAEHVSTEAGRLEIAERVLNDAYRHADSPEVRKRIEAKMLELGARHELLDLNERFQVFVKSTKAGAFSKKRQFEVFMRSLGHNGRDIKGRKLGIDNLGRIAPLGSE